MYIIRFGNISNDIRYRNFENKRDQYTYIAVEMKTKGKKNNMTVVSIDHGKLFSFGISLNSALSLEILPDSSFHSSSTSSRRRRTSSRSDSIHSQQEVASFADDDNERRIRSNSSIISHCSIIATATTNVVKPLHNNDSTHTIKSWK